MKFNGTHYRSIWFDEKVNHVKIIDQRWLPHQFKIVSLLSLKDFEVAIRDMWVRGAPLIGATAAYGVAVQMQQDPSDNSLEKTWGKLHSTRPTAINLKWALDRCKNTLLPVPECDRALIAMELAHEICAEDIEINRSIGSHGLEIIKKIAAKKKDNEPVRILTHCNAGWLATVDWGTATSPMYHAFNAGINIHVWVDE
ncbi:MAG: S-methyl-5-thioribose-1-phosphate isomerase, partial [Rhodospirillaceae bacterium]|nr:S-methyl-5-thioribose-1-phosphate isomerase [Rhodospirillaceae bacterium]